MYFFKKDRRQPMKNTNLTRAAASLLACGMVFGLTACSSSASSSEATAESAASSEAASESTVPDDATAESAADDYSYLADFSFSDAYDENGYLKGITALDYVTLPDTESFTLSDDATTVSDSDIDNYISNNILSNYKTTNEITNRAAENGDTVNIDFAGSIDGVAFDGGTGSDYDLTLGSGKMRKIMDENIESVEKFIAHQLPDFVASLVAPLVLVIILLGIDWRYGVVCLVGIVLAFIVQFAGFNGEAKEKMHRFQTAQENMNSASVEYVRGMSEIKAFNQTADSFKRLSKSITDYTSFVLEYALGWQNCMPAFTTIINNIYLLLIPVGVLIGMHTTDFREYSLTFIFYLIIVHAISGVLNKIMYISESFTQIDGSVERMDEILRIPVLPEKSTAATIENYGIAFRDVSFSYEADSQVKALSHVSFFADQGKVTAIVGPSGGGKSTIASLISRFYDVTDGSIQIGGVDIRDIPLDALMDKVSFVFQDTFLFKQSILDNIRMGNPDATEEQVIAAAKAARCHEFIEQLPNGYQTVIGSTGVHLSGGERQRIAIARAIVKDAPIIVLDEATAFSDPENEYLIQKAFEKLIQNKTVVMIAHRLSTIRNADQILIMEKGCLIESGTHDELLKKDGKYAQMWSSYTESINWKIGTGKAV